MSHIILPSFLPLSLLCAAAATMGADRGAIPAAAEPVCPVDHLQWRDRGQPMDDRLCRQAREYVPPFLVTYELH